MSDTIHPEREAKTALPEPGDLPARTPLAGMKAFLRCFLQFAGPKAAWALVLVIIVGLLEGAGLLALLPMLHLLGVGDSPARIALEKHISAFFQQTGIPLTLPVVLGVFMVLTCVQVSLRLWLDVFNTRLESFFTVHLRQELYAAVLRANWLFFTRQRGSDIAQALTDEIQRVASGTQQLLTATGATAVALVQVALVFALSPALTLLALGCGGLLVLALRPMTRKAQKVGHEGQERRREMMAAITEHLGGMKAAKSHGREGRHLSHFQAVIGQIASHAVSLARAHSRARAAYETGAVLALSCFIYGAVRFARLPSQELLLFIFIFTRLLARMSSIHASWQRVEQMIPFFLHSRKLRDQFLAAGEPPWPDAPAPLTLREGIRLENVSFRYADSAKKPAVREVDLFIPAGRTFAICGPSGGGKTTLADLLLGLLTPSSGRVLVDGQPLEGELAHQWRQSIGYVSQDPFLFHDTVRANLLWVSPEATEAQIEDVLRVAAAGEFVRHLPQGLDTVLGDRGARLSGGERQRLTLARALLRQPSLLILDEATSSLDSENERLVKETIHRLHGEMTVIVIAHRLSTLRQADTILVLAEGRVVEQGSWEELSARPNSAFGKMIELKEI